MHVCWPEIISCNSSSVDTVEFTELCLLGDQLDQMVIQLGYMFVYSVIKMCTFSKNLTHIFRFANKLIHI